MSSKAHNFDEKERTKDVIIDEQLNFNSLLLSDATLQGLQKLGFHKPSPIQLKAVPIGKCGFDLIVKSKSGTGKTLVFALIALELACLNRKGVQVLVLAPTREIAVQIQGVLQDLGAEQKGLLVESFIGGQPLEEDKAKVSKCHIAVGAPGRVKHLIKLGALKLTNVKLFVLDEIDKLMEQNTGADILEISQLLPTSKQVIAVSATYSPETEEYLKKITPAPTFVEPNSSTPLLLGLKQFVSVVKSNLNVVHQISIKSTELVRILTSVSFTQCLIFTNFQTRAESISNFLNGKGWQTNYISGAQTQTERLKVIEALKSGKCRILLSTDLTARGIDASNVDLIINYDVPYSASTYLHRMGRAGRFGSKGVCITIVAEGKDTTDFQKVLGDIAGADFTISKLPKDELPNNLLDFNTDSLEVIKAILDTDNSKESKRILESVSEIKALCKASNKRDDNVDTIQNLLDRNKLSDESEHSEMEALISTLASGGLPEANSTKRKRKKSKQETAIKNVALLNVAKLLANPAEEDAKEVSNMLEGYLQGSDDDMSGKLNEETANNLLEMIERGEDPHLELTSDEKKLEDIFQLSYDYAVKPNAPYWLDVLGDTIEDPNKQPEEEKEVITLFRSPKKRYKSNRRAVRRHSWRNSEDSEYLNENEVFGKTAQKHMDKYVERPVKAQASTLTDKPQEVAVSGYEQNPHFEECFQRCSDNLNANMQTFESVPSFDDYFAQWQWQVQSVRDYVQQNVYLQEMNNFCYGSHYY